MNWLWVLISFKKIATFYIRRPICIHFPLGHFVHKFHASIKVNHFTLQKFYFSNSKKKRKKNYLFFCKELFFSMWRRMKRIGGEKNELAFALFSLSLIHCKMDRLYSKIAYRYAMKKRRMLQQSHSRSFEFALLKWIIMVQFIDQKLYSNDKFQYFSEHLLPCLWQFIFSVSLSNNSSQEKQLRISNAANKLYTKLHISKKKFEQKLKQIVNFLHNLQ